jgi:hypothetical protein
MACHSVLLFPSLNIDAKCSEKYMSHNLPVIFLRVILFAFAQPDFVLRHEGVTKNSLSFDNIKENSREAGYKGNHEVREGNRPCALIGIDKLRGNGGRQKNRV